MLRVPVSAILRFPRTPSTGSTARILLCPVPIPPSALSSLQISQCALRAYASDTRAQNQQTAWERRRRAEAGEQQSPEAAPATSTARGGPPARRRQAIPDKLRVGGDRADAAKTRDGGDQEEAGAAPQLERGALPRAAGCIRSTLVWNNGVVFGRILSEERVGY